MAAKWTMTLNAANSSGRREFSYWIYFDTRATPGSYYLADEQMGDWITGCENTHGHVVPGVPREGIVQGNINTGGRYVVAGFHTHTPLHYCDEGERRVGPSGSDDSYYTSQGIPGILYDYLGNNPNNYLLSYIYAGHPLNAPTHLYTMGPQRKIGL
jgi:hypothetical protein